MRLPFCYSTGWFLWLFPDEQKTVKINLRRKSISTTHYIRGTICVYSVFIKNIGWLYQRLIELTHYVRKCKIYIKISLRRWDKKKYSEHIISRHSDLSKPKYTCNLCFEQRCNAEALNQMSPRKKKQTQSERDAFCHLMPVQMGQ